MLDNLTENQRKTLFLLRRNKRMSRSELAKALGITRASVSVQVKNLIEAGLLREAEKIEANRRGQPSIALELAPRRAYSVGISLSPEHISTVLMDLTGEILAESREENEHDSIFKASQAAKETFEKLAQTFADTNATFLGTGVSLPVNFHGSETFAVGSNLHQWSQEDAKASLRRVLGPNVFVENDATAAAIGENALGNPSDFSSFFYLYLGKGIGGAPVIDGQVPRGHFGNAGRVGALSRSQILRPSLMSLGAELDHLNVPATERGDLCRSLDIHADELRAWSAAAICELCETIFQITAILDPQGIVIGGTMPFALRDWLKDHVHFCDLDYPYAHQVTCPTIVTSEIPGDFAASIGAATLFGQILAP